MMEEWVLSVGQLNEYVRRALAADPMLKRVKLRGEISNFKRHVSGHLYFSLKDDEARVSCVMFRSSAQTVRFNPENGMRVVLSGQVGLYAKDGQYQFYADGMRADGVGDLFTRFEALKRRLEAEGLFDAARKRPLPLLPRIVGVVTSSTGAAIRDIIKVASRRNPRVRILLCPSRVQGDGAADELVRAIGMLSAIPEVDVLLVGRGGGSIEELWAFNEEAVARAIVSCPLPVVSAVGHETDFTIADFAADLRAATPSAAAELIVPQISSLQYSLDVQRRRLRTAADQALLVADARLGRARERLNARHPSRAWQLETLRLRRAGERMAWMTAQTLQSARTRVTALGDRLRALSPDAVLARGYAYLTSEEGAPLPDAKSLRAGQRFSAAMRDGAVDAVAKMIRIDSRKEV